MDSILFHMSVWDIQLAQVWYSAEGVISSLENESLQRNVQFLDYLLNLWLALAKMQIVLIGDMFLQV